MLKKADYKAVDILLRFFEVFIGEALARDLTAHLKKGFIAYMDKASHIHQQHLSPGWTEEGWQRLYLEIQRCQQLMRKGFEACQTSMIEKQKLHLLGYVRDALRYVCDMTHLHVSLFESFRKRFTKAY